MAIIHQLDKRSGITYAYETIYFWDKEKRQSRSKRSIIGRVVPGTGNVVPTDGRMKKSKPEDGADRQVKPGVRAVTKYTRRFYGATYLLDSIGDKIGLTEDLQKCFPDTYQQILSLAYYLILEDNNPLYRFKRWSGIHKHPYGKAITSQRSSELFMAISEDAIHHFFRLQRKRRKGQEYIVYDTTSFSCYSKVLKQARYGYNKEGDSLPQLNMALVFGEESNLPFYYRKLAGNIPDVKTVKVLLTELDIIGLDQVKLVMDKGFFSVVNINGLMKENIKFLISVKISLKIIRSALDSVGDKFITFEQYNKDHNVHSTTVQSEWNYIQDRRNKIDRSKENRRIYIHIYYSIDRASDLQKKFESKLIDLKQEILSRKRNKKNENAYKKFFDITKTQDNSIQVTVKENEVKKAKQYFGFFTLLSNAPMDAITALELYRNKDVVEKAFGNIKERLGFRRPLVSSEKSLDGKIFVEFVALIYLSYLKKQMELKNLTRAYSFAELLDELEAIECFERPGRKMFIGEVLEKQKQLYRNLDVLPPASS